MEWAENGHGDKSSRMSREGAITFSGRSIIIAFLYRLERPFLSSLFSDLDDCTVTHQSISNRDLRNSVLRRLFLATK